MKKGNNSKMDNGIYFKIAGQKILTCCKFFQFKLNLYPLQFLKYKTKSINFFLKFDEKRARTPRWVIRFTSKLLGRQISTWCTFLQFQLNIYLLLFLKYNTKSIKIKKKIDRRAEPADTFLKENHPMTISSKFCSY